MEKAALKGIFAKGYAPVGAEYKTALTDVVRAFPYFNLAQVLIAKQMYDSHDPEATSRVKLAAVYAPDRKSMYLLFKKPAYKTEEVKPVSTPLAKPEREEVKYNFVYSSTTTENRDAIRALPKEEEMPSLSEAFIRKELEEKAPVVQPIPEKPVRTIKPVEKAVAPTPKVEVKKPEVKEVEPIISTPVKKNYAPPTIEKQAPEPEKKVEEVIPPIAPVIAVADKPLVEEKKTEVVPESPVSTNEPITESNLRYSFSSWLNVIPEISVEKKEEVKPVSQKETSNIIDTFLKKAPSISRPKAEFFSPVKAAKKSITEDDALVSETLAKIYVTQGNWSKALKAYETLLLQFPEKKNIFAARIKEIKVLIQENTKPGTK